MLAAKRGQESISPAERPVVPTGIMAKSTPDPLLATPAGRSSRFSDRLLRPSAPPATQTGYNRGADRRAPVGLSSDGNDSIAVRVERLAARSASGPISNFLRTPGAFHDKAAFGHPVVSDRFAPRSPTEAPGGGGEIDVENRCDSGRHHRRAGPIAQNQGPHRERFGQGPDRVHSRSALVCPQRQSKCQLPKLAQTRRPRPGHPVARPESCAHEAYSHDWTGTISSTVAAGKLVFRIGVPVAANKSGATEKTLWSEPIKLTVK